MKEEKALLRSVMRLLHPDLFAAYPTEQEINASALKVRLLFHVPLSQNEEQKLNHYLDELALHTRPEPVSLRFWIKKESTLEEIATRLESDGLLAPLYHALGLISHQDYLQWTAGTVRIVDSDHKSDDHDIQKHRIVSWMMISWTGSRVLSAKSLKMENGMRLSRRNSSTQKPKWKLFIASKVSM